MQDTDGHHFLKAGRRMKMQGTDKERSIGAVSEIAAILAAGIIRMKKKEKLKGK